ncbi:MAG TPA: outer membrane lipid asymmetry maintenance protein MlaD [Aestuariivirga sp.]
MKSDTLETLVGAAVVVVAFFFLIFAWDATGHGGASGGYRVSAQFDNISGINVGTDVRIAGIKVGTVVGQALDPKSYQARLIMQLRPEVNLSDDTSAKITSEGLLGAQFVSLEPGGSDGKLKDGSEISYTQGSVDMWNLISQAMFSKGKGADTKGADAKGAGATGADTQDTDKKGADTKGATPAVKP